MDENARVELVFKKWTDIAAGAIGSTPGELVHSFGRVVKSAFVGDLVRQLNAEIERLQAAGSILPDWMTSDQGRACLGELAEFFDGEYPEREKFDCLRRIFLVAATSGEGDGVIPQQLMRIIRSLNSGEVLLLFATWRLRRDIPQDFEGAEQWLQFMASRSPLRYVHLVAVHESTLMAKRLLSPRTKSGGGGVELGGEHNRLTDLGCALCEYVERFDENEVNGVVSQGG